MPNTKIDTDIKRFERYQSVVNVLLDNEFVRQVDSMFKLAEAVKKRVTGANVRVEKLTQAILAKAFHGELVPIETELARREGRSYESASVLLARIKSETHSKEISGKSRRNKGRQKVIVNVNQ